MMTQKDEQEAVGGLLDRMEELRTIDASTLIAAVRVAVNSGNLKLHTVSAIRRGLAAVAPAVESVAASQTRKTAFAAAPCSAALTWTVEKPRASGMWWWWNLDPRCAPDMVEVRASDVLSWYGLGPTMHWPGLTRVRNVMTVGGVWAGPVNPPKTPSAETTANVAHERDDEAKPS